LVIALALGSALCGAALADPASRDTAPISPAAQAVLATTPGWSQVFTTGPRVGYLPGIDFVDASYGWAAGSGAVFATTDGGATWTEQSVPQGTGQLWSVSFADRLHGWACGRGVILGTSNGGSTWTTQYTNPDFEYMSVDCSDPTHAWAAGQHLGMIGTVLQADGGAVSIVATTNGSTWSAQSTDATGYTYGMDFVDSTHGWIMTGCFASMDGIVLATTDGGATWGKQSLGVFTKPFDVQFLDRSEGWVLGYESDRLFHTTDGGETWQGWKSGGLRCIHFTDSLHGFAAGLRFNDDFTIKDSGIYSTSDGGHTWTLVLARPVGEATNRMDFGDASHGCAVAFNTVDYDVDGISTCTWSILRYVGASSDTTPPTTQAFAATARRGKTALLRYRVNDPAPNGGTATVTIKIKNKAGKVVKTLRPVVKPVNTALTWKFTVPRTWKAGTYKFNVSATDAAGNKATIVSNKLIVR
jgi:photosystem II stability/assembly factor-like uncharacterized protein